MAAEARSWGSVDWATATTATTASGTMDYLDPRADGRCGSYQVDHMLAARKANYADVAHKQAVLYSAGDAIRARRSSSPSHRRKERPGSVSIQRLRCVKGV